MDVYAIAVFCIVLYAVLVVLLVILPCNAAGATCSP